MRTLSFASRGFEAALSSFCRGAAVSRGVTESVSTILSDVLARGDAAVARYALMFDRVKLSPSDFRVKASELSSAARGLPAERKAALVAAHASIRDFNARFLPANWTRRNRDGAQVGEKFDPIRRVGLYIPGGQVPLSSTVLMTATLARIAGCPEIAAFTPSGADGRVAPEILAALHLVGVSEVYRIGGVQAIGAMAYGTRSVPAVDKVFGPGNAFVCEAKRQVFGTVGVDLLPGPSEVMVIADETARADFVAADLLAQAEHGSGREKIYLVSTSSRFIGAVAGAMNGQLAAMAEPKKARKVMNRGFLAVKVSTLSQAARVANRVAPEHLEIIVRERDVAALVDAVTTAGAIMIGNATPTALGDFTAGPSHVLPTAGAGRFSSGLRVSDFLRRTSVVRYDASSIRRAAPTVAAFAAMEALEAHGRSVAIRISRASRR